MANGALIFTWGNPVSGREIAGVDQLRDSFDHYNQLVDEGRVDRVRVFFNRTGDTTDWSGTMVVEGNLDKLRQIQTEDTYQRNLERAHLVVNHLTVMTCIGGTLEDLAEPLSHYTEALTKVSPAVHPGGG